MHARGHHGRRRPALPGHCAAPEEPLRLGVQPAPPTPHALEIYDAHFCPSSLEPSAAKSVVQPPWPQVTSNYRYSLDLRVAADKRSALLEAVMRISPAAQLTETGTEHLSFSLPQASVDLPSLFEEVRECNKLPVHLSCNSEPLEGSPSPLSSVPISATSETCYACRWSNAEKLWVSRSTLSLKQLSSRSSWHWHKVRSTEGSQWSSFALGPTQMSG